MTTIGAPMLPVSFASVWTGSLMVVWGGLGTSAGGARYDPLTDVWSPTSMVGAPAGRIDGTPVWTGSRMIIWGGESESSQLLNSGARYDPVHDTWEPTSLVGAPPPRKLHTAVWTGKRMVIWAGWGGDFDFPFINDGAQYIPATDTWAPISTPSALEPRRSHTAVWTGEEMIVWGGYGGTNSPYQWFGDGGRYLPAIDTWVPVTSANGPVARDGHSMVWTGSRAFVWGGGNFL